MTVPFNIFMRQTLTDDFGGLHKNMNWALPLKRFSLNFICVLTRIGLRKFIINIHCVKSVRIWSFSGPYFAAFGLNTERYRISHRIQSNTDTFYAVITRHLVFLVENNNLRRKNEVWNSRVTNSS